MFWVLSVFLFERVSNDNALHEIAEFENLFDIYKVRLETIIIIYSNFFIILKFLSKQFIKGFIG